MTVLFHEQFHPPNSRLLVKMAICHHAILPSETSQETEIQTTTQACAEESRKYCCWFSCVCHLCISVRFLWASLFGALGLTFMISIVSLQYFLPTASRAEWSCGRGWNATASSGTSKTFILNFGMDVRSSPVPSRPAGCPVPPAPQSFPPHLQSPHFPLPQQHGHPLPWASQKGIVNFVLALNTACSQCDMVHLWSCFL